MQEEILTSLIYQQMSGTLSEKERIKLAALLEDEKNKPVVLEAFICLMETQEMKGDEYSVEYYRPLLQQVLAADKAPKVKRMPVRWWRYAAAVLLLLMAGGAFLLLDRDPVPVKGNIQTLRDIQPGTNGAILTLTDGSTLVLDSLKNGLIATQGNTTVRMQDNQVIYDDHRHPGAEISWNSIRTPRGKQFQLLLPDGTKVWLNAASSLKYPVAFNGKERNVEVTGEVYFEVAQNAGMPFRVKINEGTSIDVLGTHFNVNAYADEASINATLLAGSIRVNADKQAKVLRPGQQARIDRKSLTVINDADTEQAVAWKNGTFYFNDADLPAVMRQLSRWYNIDVIYEGTVPEGKFNGEIGKGLTLAQVLKGLTNARIKYKAGEGDTIIILP